MSDADLTRGLHRCWACTDPWVGTNLDAENRCPPCIAADRHPPRWFDAWRRALQIQGRAIASDDVT